MAVNTFNLLQDLIPVTATSNVTTKPMRSKYKLVGSSETKHSFGANIFALHSDSVMTSAPTLFRG